MVLALLMASPPVIRRPTTKKAQKTAKKRANWSIRELNDFATLRFATLRLCSTTLRLWISRLCDFATMRRLWKNRQKLWAARIGRPFFFHFWVKIGKIGIFWKKVACFFSAMRRVLTNSHKRRRFKVPWRRFIPFVGCLYP